MSAAACTTRSLTGASLPCPETVEPRRSAAGPDLVGSSVSDAGKNLGWSTSRLYTSQFSSVNVTNSVAFRASRGFERQEPRLDLGNGPRHLVRTDLHLARESRVRLLLAAHMLAREEEDALHLVPGHETQLLEALHHVDRLVGAGERQRRAVAGICAPHDEGCDVLGIERDAVRADPQRAGEVASGLLQLTRIVLTAVAAHIPEGPLHTDQLYAIDAIESETGCERRPGFSFAIVYVIEHSGKCQALAPPTVPAPSRSARRVQSEAVGCGPLFKRPALLPVA